MLKNLLVITGVFLLSFCGQAEDLSNRDTLKVGVSTEAVTMDPYGSNDNATARVSVNVFDRLLEKDAEGNFLPSLATAWEMLSPTQLKLTLRTNAMFHNGEMLSPEDVKFSVDRMIASPEIEHIVSPIKSIEVTGEDTVLITLKDPFTPILFHLAHSTMGILNKKAVEEAGEDLGQKPVGTGPYKLKQWNRGQSILLEKHEGYWGKAPKVPNLEIRIIPESSARTIALETGDIDVAYDIGAVDRERVMDHANLTLIEEPIARIEYFGYNIGKGKNPIWKDQRVREAVSLAIDREGIINSVLFGSGTPASSIIYETVVGYYDGLTLRQRDVEKAKALIKEASIPEGTKISMWTTEGARQKMMEIIQANLKEIGIDASIEIYEWGRFLDGTSKGEHDTFILGWTTVTGDADYGIYNLVHTDAFGSPGNRTFYSNPTVDRLLDQARIEVDPVKRDEMYKEVQIILDAELPFFPLFYPLSNVGTSKNVKGFVFDPADAHRLSTLYF
ncbi:MAG: ABC transporter substrate-binding protein [Brevinema sp.]